MRELRARNMEKPRQEEIDAKYCVCRTTATSSMLQCQLCKDWFHSKFVCLRACVRACVRAFVLSCVIVAHACMHASMCECLPLCLTPVISNL